MRYRIYFKISQPVEVEAYAFQVISPRTIHCFADASQPPIAVRFCEEIIRVADDDDRTKY